VTPEPTAGGRWLQTRPHDLVAETLSDETLVIDTVSGVFFSLRGVASALWSMLSTPTTDDDLRTAVRERFADVPSTDAEVDAFVASLEAEHLVVAGDTPGTGTATDAPAWPAAYEPPVLKKYDDMADLLLVDPIHDVAAETGWPERRPDTP
jgi:coenzyme PQQ synthesis protein D (PqqD)